MTLLQSDRRLSGPLFNQSCDISYIFMKYTLYLSKKTSIETIAIYITKKPIYESTLDV